MSWSENEAWIAIQNKFEIDQALMDKIESDVHRYNYEKDAKGRNKIESCLNKNPNDLHSLCNAVTDHYKLAKKAAAEITRVFAWKAIYQKDVSRKLRVGIKYATWVHMDAGRHPCAHKPLHGKEFKLIDGVMFEGKRIYPSLEPGCMCVYSALIPGFDGPKKKPGFFARLFRR